MSRTLFCSEVEMGGFLGSLDLIQDVYQANLETSNSTCYKLHQNFSGFHVLAFNCSSDYTTRFLNGGFDLVSSKDHEVIDFVATKVNPLFSINEAAVRLFEGLFVELKELENQLIFKPLIVTGRSLGGYIAILFSLWLQHAIDEKEADGVKDTKRPICITFGCPLIGNKPFQKAISERPQWKSRFLNVVAKTDPIASFHSSNSLYKPFGTSLFCTESGGHIVFEDQESVPAVLHATPSSITENTEIPDYGNHLKSIQTKLLYRGVSELGKFDSNSLRAGITLQFNEVDHVRDDNSNDPIAKIEKERIEANRKHRMSSLYDPTKTKKLNDAKISMVCMELYMKNGRSKGGYYDTFKTPAKTKHEIESHQEIVKNKRILNQYWTENVEEKNLTPQKEGAKMRKRWLYGGNTYRRIVEPLDIAEYYKPNGEYYDNGKKHYRAKRPKHYELLERWLNEDKKGLNPNERSSNKAASLNDDSCFWADVEEGLILLGKLKDEGFSCNEKLEDFESKVMGEIKSYSLSPDVFLEGSSFMKWWNEYKEYKGGLYVSEFAQFMNSGEYKSYK
ncbi:hypothetical protein L6452_41634 [Arctium lappa]|uniref:Uncharacterized protein n=1 Tax=Arctium lappa TaxID=4217 RepID=A0ACB8XPT6_ARCLA|nr:hypothetical protein L6452_41634 [Arctium lappa]